MDCVVWLLDLRKLKFSILNLMAQSHLVEEKFLNDGLHTNTNFSDCEKTQDSKLLN